MLSEPARFRTDKRYLQCDKSFEGQCVTDRGDETERENHRSTHGIHKQPLRRITAVLKQFRTLVKNL
jgi:hypothetical protein